MVLAVALALAASAACGGSDGAAGATGPSGTDGPGAGEVPASIALVEPRVGLSDRTVDVGIALQGVTLVDGAVTVELGEGITAGPVRVVGSSSLRVELTIDGAAALGPRDVVVRADGASLTAKAGFVVASPLDVRVTGGKAEQGGLVRVDVGNRDRRLFNPETFSLGAASAPQATPVVSVGALALTATDGTFVLLGEPLARPGAVALLGTNDPTNPEAPTFLSAPDALALAARAPEALALGDGATDRGLDKTLRALETGFFSIDLPAPAAGEGWLVDVDVTRRNGGDASPLVAVFGDKGTFADLVDLKQDDPGFPAFGIPAVPAAIGVPETTGGRRFVLAFDGALGASAALRVDARAYAAALVAEQAAAHGLDDAPQTVAVAAAGNARPGALVTATLGRNEIDVYRVTGTADLEVQIASDADLVVFVDAQADFQGDAPAVLEMAGSRAGRVRTEGLPGNERFIAVLAAEGATRATGGYRLGLRRLPAAP